MARSRCKIVGHKTFVIKGQMLIEPGNDMLVRYINAFPRRAMNAET